ncbi:hypothetical protein TWF718_004990 [Orbilia javanica]|uniref:Uncharacterized protein n=1 Tax=Orbilia javanica TaxID=47235 RepID=A0AAN8N966_9PEZI
MQASIFFLLSILTCNFALATPILFPADESSDLKPFSLIPTLKQWRDFGICNKRELEHRYEPKKRRKHPLCWYYLSSQQEFSQPLAVVPKPETPIHENQRINQSSRPSKYHPDTDTPFGKETWWNCSTRI